MSNHVTLVYDQPICDVKQFGQFYVALDDNLKLHRITPSIKKEKTFTVVKTDSLPLHKAILKGNIIGYANKKTLYALSIKDKKILPYRWYGGDVTTFASSSDGHYLAAGYPDGKVNIFSVDIGGIYASLSLECGTIKYLHFDSKSSLLLVLGERNRVIVHDTLFNRTICTIPTETRVSFGVFLEGFRLFCVHDNGDTSIMDIQTGKILSLNNNQIKNPTALATNTERDYAIIGDKNGKITVIHLKYNKILFTHEVEAQPVLGIKWVEKTLFFLFYDGKVRVYPLANDLQIVEESIKEQSFYAASHAIKKNTFLSLFSSIESKLDEIWNETIFPQTIDLILDGEEGKAREVAEPFLHDVYKKKVYNLYAGGSEVTQHFLKAYINNDYATIFTLADQYPHLKKSTKYKVVNDEWELAFHKAFDVMKSGHKVKAGQILHPFNNTEKKKNLISLLINFPQIFIDADFYFKNRRVKEYFQHTAKNKILQNTPQYAKIIQEADKIKTSLEIAQEKGDIKVIVAYAKRLALYQPYRAMAKGVIDSIRGQILFQDFLKKDKIADIYHLAESHYEISQLPAFKKLHLPYEKAEKIAYRASYKGDTHTILNTLEPFLGIPTLKDKIAPIMKLAYLKQIESVPHPDLVDWRATLEYYSLYFGIDQDVRETMQKIGMEEMLYKMVGGKDRFGYRKYDFVSSLIKEKTTEQMEAEKYKNIETKDRTHLRNYLLVGGGILAFVIAVKLVTMIFSSSIEAYKNDRRQGPYKLFEKIYEQRGETQ